MTIQKKKTMCPIDYEQPTTTSYTYIPPPPPPPPSLPAVWFADRAGNPIANQYYDKTDPLNPKYVQINKIALQSFTDTTDKILVQISTGTFPKLPIDIVTHIQSNAKPMPPLPAPPDIKTDCTIDNTYQLRYQTMSNYGLTNSGNTCWIAASLQVIYAMYDLRHFFMKNQSKLDQLPPELKIVGEHIYKLRATMNTNISNYDDFYNYYGYNGQPKHREGDVDVFLGTFFYHLEQYCKTPTLPLLDESGSFPYNLQFIYLTSFGTYNTNYYYFDTTIKETEKSRENVYASDKFGSSKYEINNIFSISDFSLPISAENSSPIQSTKDLILNKIYPFRQLLTGKSSKEMTIHGQKDFVHLYNFGQYIRIPKIVAIIVHPLYDVADLNPSRNKINGGADENKYLNNIDLCFSAIIPGKISAMNYFLTGIICFQGSPGIAGHYVAITIHKISSTNITYNLYNDDHIAKSIVIPISATVFPSTSFSNGTLKLSPTDDDFYPYVLIYERFSDIDKSVSPPKYLE